MSKLLFIRSYLIIVCLILFVGLGLDRIMSYYTSQGNITTEKNLLRGSFHYIKSLLKADKKNTLVFWDANYLSIQEELGYPLALYQLSDFSSQEQILPSLKTGKTIVMTTENNDLIYYQQIQNTLLP
jgi:hypothetical protein